MESTDLAIPEKDETIAYICITCNQPLDEETMQSQSHPCWTANLVDATEHVEGEHVEYLQESTADDLKFEKLEWSGFRKRGPNKSRRGEWADEDVRRLIDIYIKNYRSLPQQERLHNHYLWDRIMRDLKPYGDFSRFLVQAKIKKLKLSCRVFIEQGNDIKWPYFNQMCELLRVESEVDAKVNTEEGRGTDTELGERTDSDNEDLDSDNQVKGLRRWTIKETRHLINVYKKYLPQFFKNGNRRKIAWNEIIADLQYDLPKRFTMYQIRAKIRNVQNTYRSIVGKKRKKDSTHWPLFKDLADLAKAERDLARLHDVPVAIYRYGQDRDADTVMALPAGSQEEDDGESQAEEKGIRWNVEETQELINAYKNSLFELCVLADEDKKADIWKKIAADVNTIRRRKINRQQAMSKIASLRALYVKGDEKSLSPLYEEVKQVIEAERSIEKAVEEPPDYQTPPTPPLRERKKIKIINTPDVEEVPPVKRKNIEQLPTWFVNYSQDAQRRHEEKINIQHTIIDVLENILFQS